MIGEVLVPGIEGFDLFRRPGALPTVGFALPNVATGRTLPVEIRTVNRNDPGIASCPSFDNLPGLVGRPVIDDQPTQRPNSLLYNAADRLLQMLSLVSHGTDYHISSGLGGGSRGHLE